MHIVFQMSIYAADIIKHIEHHIGAFLDTFAGAGNARLAH